VVQIKRELRSEVREREERGAYHPQNFIILVTMRVSIANPNDINRSLDLLTNKSKHRVDYELCGEHQRLPSVTVFGKRRTGAVSSATRRRRGGLVLRLLDHPSDSINRVAVTEDQQVASNLTVDLISPQEEIRERLLRRRRDLRWVKEENHMILLLKNGTVC
jgi:hypothetical protein